MRGWGAALLGSVSGGYLVMRLRSVARRLCAAAVSATLLAGCSGLGAEPIPPPTPGDILDLTTTFSNFTNRPISTAEDYVFAGYAFTDHHCQKFFNALEQSRRDNVFAKDTLSSAGTLTTEILTLLKESQTSIGIVAGAVGYASNTLERYNNMYNFALYSPALWQHVNTAQSTFKSTDAVPTLGPIANLSIDSAAVFYQAHQIVQSYARICSLPQIEYFIHTALSNSKTVPADEPATGKDSGAVPEGRSYGRVGTVRPRALRLPVYEAR